MKIEVINNLHLEPVNVPFVLEFSWTRKRGEDAVWFTPKGKCKIHIGSLHVKYVGSFQKESDSKDLISMMKRYKTELLTDGQDIYTKSGSGPSKIENGLTLISSALRQWRKATDNGRADYYSWKNKKEYVEDVETLKLTT